MPNIADIETDEMLEKMERKIRRIYTRATKEMEQKFNDYVQQFEKMDEKMLAKVASGKITQTEYQKWLDGKILGGKKWKAMLDVLTEDCVNADKLAMSVVNGYLPQVYAINRNFAAFEVEKGSLVDTSFLLYDRQTVERLARDNPKLLPTCKPDIPKDRRWNRRKIREEITQGILQGESVKKLSKRLQNVTDMDNAAAVRNARTAVTGAQNGGRVDSYKRAKDLGIDLRQEWVATLDSRTRHSHRMLDGEKIEVGGKFSNKCRYPGDPEGPPNEIYNCRCTIVGSLTGFDFSDEPKTIKLSDMTYEEWKQGKIEKGEIYIDVKPQKDIDFDKFKYAINIDKNMDRWDVEQKWEELCPKLDMVERDYQDVYVQTSNSFDINSAFRAEMSESKRLDSDEMLNIFRNSDAFSWAGQDELEEMAGRVAGFENLIYKHKLKEDTMLTRLVSDGYSESVLGIKRGNLNQIIEDFETDSVQSALKSLVGTEVTEYGFMSTAGAIDDRFQAFGRRNVMLRLYTPKGTPALYANPDELEVILGRNTKYTIAGFDVEEQPNGWRGNVKRLIVKCVVGG